MSQRLTISKLNSLELQLARCIPFSIHVGSVTTNLFESVQVVTISEPRTTGSGSSKGSTGMPQFPAHLLGVSLTMGLGWTIHFHLRNFTHCAKRWKIGVRHAAGSQAADDGSIFARQITNPQGGAGGD